MVRRIVGIADSDSFVKWGASLLDSFPEDWHVCLVVVASALTASGRQVDDAVAGTRFTRETTRFLTVREILADEAISRADAVVVACRGPVAEVLLDAIGRWENRPALVSGLPGISIPAKWKGIFYRAQADLFVLHSSREVRAYRQLASEQNTDVEFVLATLPFARVPARAEETVQQRDTLVFAGQAIVPRELAERQLVVDRLCEVATANPHLRVVLKVRALPGEEQTHSELYPLPDLLPAYPPANLVVEAGPMGKHLDRAVGFATISSTAVLEAVARGIPSILFDDFGVGPLLINEVFADSGLLAPSSDLIELRFPELNEGWLAENYAHPSSQNTLQSRLATLLEKRDALPLRVPRPARRSRGGALRRAWDRRIALGRHDRSALGLVALVIGWPLFTLRKLRRDRLVAAALATEPVRSGDPGSVPAPLRR